MDNENLNNQLTGKHVDVSKETESMDYQNKSYPIQIDEDNKHQQFILQSLEGIEKDLNSIIEEMQRDLEQSFGELISSIADHIQSRISIIHSKVDIIAEKMSERKEIASHLEKAEIAIQTFYKSVDEQHED